MTLALLSLFTGAPMPTSRPSHRSTAYRQTDALSSGRVVITPERLTFGRKQFLAGDIVGLRIETGEKASLVGNICAGVIFLGIAGLIMGAIVGQIFPDRAINGVITLGCVGLASIQDSWGNRGHGFYTLLARTALQGEQMVFATPDRGEMVAVWSRLADVLDARVLAPPAA
jgi:hypothetical protein